jgi:iron complex transport system substrate-binding protein
MTCERIASLLASGTEILYGLGLGDRVVAVSHECDFPGEVVHKPRVTSTHVRVAAPSRVIDQQVGEMARARAPVYEIDVETLVALAPDLIVTQAQCEVCAVDFEDVLAAVATRPELQETRIVALNPTTLNSIFEDIQNVGDAAGCTDAAKECVASLRSRVDAVRHRAARVPAASRPRVVCLEWLDPPMVAANWMPELIEIAGGHCPLTGAGEKSRYANWDEVVGFDPQVLVLMPCGFDLRRTLDESPVCRALPQWDQVAAVRADRVYAVDGNAYFNRSGPRIVDSLELLAGLLHPALFAEFRQAYAYAQRVLPPRS